MWDLQIDRLIESECNYGTPSLCLESWGIVGCGENPRSILGEQQRKHENFFSCLNNPNTSYLFIPVPCQNYLNDNIYENKNQGFGNLVHMVALQMLKHRPKDVKGPQSGQASAGRCAQCSITCHLPAPHNLSMAQRFWKFGFCSS